MAVNANQHETRSVTSGRAFSETVLSMRWLSLVVVYIGMLMVNQFFAQLSLGRFSQDGFSDYVSNLEANANVDRFSRSIMSFLADNAALFAPLLAVFVAVAGLMCMLLLARSAVVLVVSAFFWMLWYASSATSGIWTFEYLFPAAFALITGLATLPHFVGADGRDRWLGARLLGSLPMRIWVLVTIVIAVLLGWFFSMAESGGADNYVIVSVVSAVAFIVLLGATGILDRWRTISTPVSAGWAKRLTKVPWEALMIVCIGAMMTIQVFADVQVGWFDASGYEALVSSYATNTGAPGWWSSFLNFVADNAEIFMPLQAIAEFACGFFLVTLIVRSLALFATFGFFFSLMFSEFGVSATIKAGSENTWEWEMLFVTGVLLMLAVAHLARALQQTTRKDMALGDRFFIETGLTGQFAFVVASSAALWAIGTQTRMFGSGYATISFRGGLYFLGCLLVMLFVDRQRTPTTNTERQRRTWTT